VNVLYSCNSLDQPQATADTESAFIFSLAPDFSQVGIGNTFTLEPFQRFTPENR